MNRTVIKEKIGLIGSLVLLIITCIFIAVILSDYTMPNFFPNMYSKLFALAAIFLLLFICVPNLFFPSDILIIDEKGFFDYSFDDSMPSEYQGFIPWSNVEKIFLYTEEKKIIKIKSKSNKKKSRKNPLSIVRKHYKKIIITYLVLTAFVAVMTFISMTIKEDEWNSNIYIAVTLTTPLVLMILFISIFLQGKKDALLKKGKYIGVDVKDINKIYPEDKRVLIRSNIEESKPMLIISLQNTYTSPEETILIMNRYINHSE